jgi:hypothetical protein
MGRILFTVSLYCKEEIRKIKQKFVGQGKYFVRSLASWKETIHKDRNIVEARITVGRKAINNSTPPRSPQAS